MNYKSEIQYINKTQVQGSGIYQNLIDVQYKAQKQRGDIFQLLSWLLVSNPIG